MKNKLIFIIFICIISILTLGYYNNNSYASTIMNDKNIEEALNKFNNQTDESYTYQITDNNTISKIFNSGEHYDIIYDLTTDPVFTSSIEVNSKTTVNTLAYIGTNVTDLPFLGLYIEKVINGESVESATDYARRQTVGVPYGARISFSLFYDELTYMNGPTFRDGEYDITDFVNYVYGDASKTYHDTYGAYSYTFNINESDNSTPSDKSYIISLSLTINEDVMKQNIDTSQTTDSIENSTTSAVTNISEDNIVTSAKSTFTNGFLILIIELVVIAIIAFIVIIIYTKKKSYK